MNAMEADDLLLPLSGLQHFVFCRRQWALIHLEQQWQENLLTVEGALLHQRAHDATLREHRGDTLVVRSLAVVSHTLGLSGAMRCGGIPASGRGHSPPRGNRTVACLPRGV